MAIFTKYKPISINHGIGVESHDQEGRVLTMEFERFYIVACYTPNAGDVSLFIQFTYKILYLFIGPKTIRL